MLCDAQCLRSVVLIIGGRVLCYFVSSAVVSACIPCSTKVDSVRIQCIAYRYSVEIAVT